MRKTLVSLALWFVLFDLGSQLAHLTPQHAAVIPTLDRLVRGGRIGGVFESGGAQWMIVHLTGRSEAKVFAVAEKIEAALSGFGAMEWGFPSYLIWAFDNDGSDPRNPYEDQLLIGYWPGTASGPVPVPEWP